MYGGSQMADLTVNGRTHQVDADPDTPLLWVLREWVGMTGTKYGCGIAQCGACTVHVDGIAMRSCSVPLSAVAGRQITTIEGLAQNGVLHKVQQAWLEHDVPQCGYCQSGMIMAVGALPSSWPRSWNATGRRSRPNFQLPARTSRATVCGAVNLRPEAAPSANRTSMYARPARPRAPC